MVRAALDGTYASATIASSTAFRVLALTAASPFMTRDTVLGDTPAVRATS
jgi:hypothetical protein